MGSPDERGLIQTRKIAIAAVVLMGWLALSAFRGLFKAHTLSHRWPVMFPSLPPSWAAAADIILSLWMLFVGISLFRGIKTCERVVVVGFFSGFLLRPLGFFFPSLAVLLLYINVATLGVGFVATVYILATREFVPPDPALSLRAQLAKLLPHNRFARSAMKYVVAIFLGTYGSAVVAILLTVPVRASATMMQSPTVTELLEVLLDRPYFPLQSAVAFSLGHFVSNWLNGGWPTRVWIWPAAQFVLAVVLFQPPSVMQDPWMAVREAYFIWGCGCPATGQQWKVTFPLYTSFAFSLAAYLRSRLSVSANTSAHGATREVESK
jgi:hypothetical protein